jgi:hypothetical protein
VAALGARFHIRGGVFDSYIRRPLLPSCLLLRQCAVLCASGVLSALGISIAIEQSLRLNKRT